MLENRGRVHAANSVLAHLHLRHLPIRRCKKTVRSRGLGLGTRRADGQRSPVREKGSLSFSLASHLLARHVLAFPWLSR